MTYIVRIELASNIMADFNKLHQEMNVRGFSRTITSAGNKDYYLPKATYSIATNSDKSRVLSISKEAVSQTGKTAEILVIEYNSCTWSGLKEV